MHFGAAGNTVGCARFGDAERRRRIGEANSLRERHAFRQADRQRRVECVASAGGIDNIDRICRHQARVIVGGDDPRALCAQGHHRCLIIARQQSASRRNHILNRAAAEGLELRFVGRQVIGQLNCLR